MSFGPQFAKLTSTTAATGGEQSAPRREGIFFNNTGAAITDGEMVGIDTTDTTYGLGASIAPTTGVADTFNVVGCADEDIPSGKFGRVVISGVKVGVAATAVAITAGHGVQLSGTGGKVETQGGAAGTEAVVGFALATSAGTTVDVYLTLG